MVDRIFDPFFTTKDVGVGTGLGLSLVHGIRDAGRRAIDVSSTPGEAACSRVPAPRRRSARGSDADKSALQRGNRQRVLVIDDEEALMRLTTETLEELGYEPIGSPPAAPRWRPFAPARNASTCWSPTSDAGCRSRLHPRGARVRDIPMC